MFSGYEAFSSMIEEIKEPQHLKKAYFVTCTFVAFTYLVSIIPFISVATEWSNWKVGDFAKFAQKVGGTPFFYIVQYAAIIGQFMSLCASMITRTYLIVNLGRREYLDLPFLLCKQNLLTILCCYIHTSIYEGVFRGSTLPSSQ